MTKALALNTLIDRWLQMGENDGELDGQFARSKSGTLTISGWELIADADANGIGGTPVAANVNGNFIELDTDSTFAMAIADRCRAAGIDCNLI